MTRTLRRVGATLLLAVSLTIAQTPGDRAYAALKAGDYPAALAAFSEAVAANPGNAALHKDLAYTLLKTGEREAARDHFSAAIRIDPADEHAALEYAFLCYETRQEANARRTFDQLRTGARSPEIRATAATAFENVDRPLREGIDRWLKAVQSSPGQWSAHEELARLAETRDQLDLAAEHYAEARRLRPSQYSLMLDLARVWERMGRTRDSIAMLIAASRCPQPRIAETARDRLPERELYPYELADALRFDPANPTLRAETETYAPPSHKVMAFRSLEKSYLVDALRYFREANEDDPTDGEVMHGLGRTYNLLGHDDEALAWFDRSRRAGWTEAERDYRSLRASNRRISIGGWALPMYSSRWGQGLFYGQVKGELKLKGTRLRPYLSARLIADTQGDATDKRVNPLFPAYLSETAVILGVGVSAPLGHGLYAWGEAGEAISYLGRRTDGGLMRPDYRAGVFWLRGYGSSLNGARRGWFGEHTADGVYVSRFQGNVVGYSQNRTGYTLNGNDGAVQLQAHWNWNATLDTKREYWANFVETGPGIRMRFRNLPPSMVFRFDMVRGVYLLNRYNPLSPNFWDFRGGVWYAFAR